MTQLSRRQFLGAAAAPWAARAAAGQRPNIILVLMDDLGYGQFAPNGDMFDLNQLNPIVSERDLKEIKPEAAVEATRIAAPNLTRLASEGTRFTDAYVACPLCAPSRSGIMTARYPQRFGGYINNDIEKGGVPLDQLFPAQLLQKTGYRTAVVGKWHLAKMQGGMDASSGQHPLDRGFDYFFGFNGCCTTYFDAQNFYRNRERAAPEGFSTDQFTEEALGFLRKPSDKPFFLYLPYNAVHGPYNRLAPAKYLDKFHTGSKRIDNFYAYLNAADEGVARIRALLKEQRQENNTLIFLISDNGASGTSPIPSNAPFLGFKGQIWQGGVRVPMLAWGPGLGVGAGKISHEPVISLDLMPTALAAAGVDLPAGYTVDGRNLLPVLRGQQKQPLHTHLFWAGQLAQKWVNAKEQDDLTAPPAWAVRKGRWLLRYWSNLDRHELYDVETDRGERHDKLAEHANIARELKSDYAEWFKGTQKPMAWGEDAWRKLAPKMN